MESLDHIEQRAAEFLGRRDAGEWSAQDQARLDAWLAASTAHRIAYLRLELTWESAGRLRALGAGLAPGTVPPPEEWKQSPFFNSLPEELLPAPDPQGHDDTPRPRRSAWRWALAASVVLALVGAATFWKLGPRGDRFSTPIGQIASVPLRDGSHITLNTASAVDIDLTPTERLVTLEHGEAFFQVAKDPSRPFVVQVGDKRVVAVGTQFSVSRDGDDVRVVVTEGTVRFEKQSTVAPVPLPAGTIAREAEGDLLVEKASVPQAEEAVSWRRGYLTFHETPLSDAVAQFNRYNARQISISDPAVASIRISGTFRPTNSDAFVRLLREGFSIQARDDGDAIELVK